MDGARDAGLVVALAFTLHALGVDRHLCRRGRALRAEGPAPARRAARRRARWRSSSHRPGSRPRMYSVFDVNDPSNRDRFAMLKSGVEMVRDHPLTGVGPDMVKTRLRRVPRSRGRSTTLNVHLHNVPMQIAAERGVPALVIWLAFIGVRAARSVPRRLTTSRHPSLAAAGPRCDRRDAQRGPLRVQLRRLRVPDALPRAHHAAVRLRPERRRGLGPDGARRPEAACRAAPASGSSTPRRTRLDSAPSSNASPASRSSSSATSCWTSSWSVVSSASRPRRRSRSSSTAVTSIDSAARRTSRTTSGRSAPCRSSSAWSASDDAAETVRRGLADGADRRRST